MQVLEKAEEEKMVFLEQKKQDKKLAARTLGEGFTMSIQIDG